MFFCFPVTIGGVTRSVAEEFINRYEEEDVYPITLADVENFDPEHVTDVLSAEVGITKEQALDMLDMYIAYEDFVGESINESLAAGDKVMLVQSIPNVKKKSKGVVQSVDSANAEVKFDEVEELQKVPLNKILKVTEAVEGDV